MIHLFHDSLAIEPAVGMDMASKVSLYEFWSN